MSPSYDGITVYRCILKFMFVKKSEDPDEGSIFKIRRTVGSNVYSTGFIWCGPAGGIWTELDVTKGETARWALVNGPGFNLAGPALVDANEVGHVTRVQIILLADTAGVLHEALVERNATIKDVKRGVCQATGLADKHCCMAKDLPGMHPNGAGRLPVDYMRVLQDDCPLASLGFGDEMRLFLVYVGEYPKDWEPLPAITIHA